MKNTTLMLLVVLSNLCYSQESQGKDMHGKDLFDKVYNSYSGNEISTIILKDGNEVRGYKKDVDRKKGQIYHIKITEEISRKKLKFKSDVISEMYLYPGGLERLGKFMNHVYDFRQWQRSDLKNDIIKKGYIYFKNQKVSLKNKKKEKEYLMQIINPTFCKYIEVYGDPFANKTLGCSMMGLQVAGGLKKSYYIKKGENIFWLHKREFAERYDRMFGDCNEFITKYPKDSIQWRHLSEYVLEYTKLKSKNNSTPK